MKRRVTMLILGSLLAHLGVRANDIEPTKEKYTAIHRGSAPIVIDGDLAEWTGVPVLSDPKFAVPKGSGPGGAVSGTPNCSSCVNDSPKPNYVLFEPYSGGTWSGPDDQTSAVEVVWDADNVYLAFTVTDDYHENSANSAWNGDSVQLMVCPAKRSGATAGVDYFLYNYALGGVEDALGDVIVQTETAPTTAPDATTTAVVRRDKSVHKTYYEIQMPADALGLKAPLTAGMQFGLAMAINDGDQAPGQTGQKGWGGLGAHAIVFGKTPSEAALITLSADLPSADKIFFSAVNPTQSGITFRVNDKGAAVFDPASLKLTVNGQNVTVVGSPKSGDATDYTYTPAAAFALGSTNTFTIQAADTKGNAVTFDGSYVVPSYLPIPEIYAVASSAADTSKPGFIWRMSQVDSVGTYEQNSTERTEAQLAGLLGPNIADPSVQGVASAPGAAPSPDSAPIQFVIPSVINLNKADGGAFGNFTPDDQMPGSPGTNGGTDNQAAEVLTWLDLPAGPVKMGVNSDDGFRLSIGGTSPKDRFGTTVGEFDGGRGAADTTFSFYVSKAGLYPARLIWENGGGDSNMEWFSVNPDGTDVLINDSATTGAIKAYQSANVPNAAYASDLSPAPNSTVGPNEPIRIVMVDGAKAIVPGTVKLTLNGAQVNATVGKTNNQTTITYAPSALLPSGSLQSGQLVFSDGTTTSTNVWSFTVASYTNLVLPAPIYIETFEELALGALPQGWSVTNMTDNATGTSDLGDPKSDAYLNWVVIDRNQVYVNGTNDFHVWEAGDPDGRVSKIAPGQVVNGKVLEATDLMEGKFMYAESDERSGRQVQVVFTKDYDLTGKTNVYVSYHSSYTQNQDNIAVAEYSIDQGKTWLPIRYFLYGRSDVTSQDGSRIAYNTDGSIDAVSTLTKYVRNGTVDDNTDPRQTNDTPQYDDGTYSVFGDFVEARPFSSLAPYIEGRINDDTTESHRVETYRIASADNQKTVRLRFAQVGTGSWYWGLDDIGFYSIGSSGGAQPQFNAVTLASGKLNLSWTGGGTLQQTDSLTNPNWVTAPSQSNPQSVTIAAGSKALFFRIKQ